MLRLGYNANGLRTLPVERAIAEVARAGFDAIELSLHPRHLDPFTFTQGDADRLRAVLDEAGLEACCLATGADNLLSEERFEPSLVSADPAGRRARIDLIVRAVRIARWLGVPMINFASGIRRPEVTPEQARGWLLDGLRALSDEAGDDVLLAIEPEPGFFVQSNDEFLALGPALRRDNVVLCQDLGHSRVVDEDYLGSVARAAPSTRHFHVEDIKGRRHYHEIPGDGDIDFPAFLSVVRRAGYDGCLSVELYNHADVYRHALQRSHDYMRALLNGTG